MYKEGFCWPHKTATIALAERLLALARDGQDETWMNVQVGNSEPQCAKKGTSSK